MRRFAFLIAVIAGCGILDPDDGCSCPPALVTTPVSGEVLDATDAPLVGVRVVTESADDADSPASTCAQPGATLVTVETLVSSNGQFSTVVRWPGARACARVFAYIREGGQTAMSDTVIFPLDPTSPGTPRSNVLLRFAPAASP